MPPTALLSLVFFALFAVHTSASPLRHDASATATLGITARMDVTGFRNIAALDRARAMAMKQVGHKRKRDGYTIPMSFSSIPDGPVFTTTVGVGNPATEYTLIVDTGSSVTWVGAQNSNPYHPTSGSVNATRGLKFQYDSKTFNGTEYLDTVTFNCGLSISQQGIGVVTDAVGFSNSKVDGVLGVGPVDLTSYRTSDGTNIPTVTNTLYSQGLIQTDALGIYFVPAPPSSLTGELTFGGPDASKTTTTMNYVPLTTTSPSSAYWGIDASISYSNTNILSNTAGIVDTGSTLVMIATNAFTQYKAATGAMLDSSTGLLKITTDQYADLSMLTFVIGGEEYGLVPNAQIWPRALNSYLGGSNDCIYLIVADIGSSSGSGMDFILGFAFLQRYYTVFDATHKEFGIAGTTYTYDVVE